MEEIDVKKLSTRDIQLMMRNLGMPLEVSFHLTEKFRKNIVSQPKGYLSTKVITRLMLMHSLIAREAVESRNVAEHAKIAVMGSIGSISRSPVIPWYWLDRNLAQDLVRTEAPASIPRDIVLPECGIIVLPKDLISSDTGGVDFIVYKLFQPGESGDLDILVCREHDRVRRYKTNMDFLGETGYHLCYSSFQTSYAYGGIIGLISEDNEYRIDVDKDPQRQYGSELAESEKLKTVLLNTIVYASQHEAEYVPAKKSFGFGKSTAKDRPSHPLFIGEGYKSRISRSVSTGTGSRKAPHWRRGHWRRVAVAKGRTQRSWRLIPPTMVGFGEGES